MQDSGHTPEWTGQSVERVLSNGKRIFVPEFRPWLVEQARKPGVSVAGLALRNGVNANLLRRWIALSKQACVVNSPALPAVLPVCVVHPAEPTPLPIAPASTSASAPIEIEVAGVVVRVHDGVDARRLRVVLDALRS